MSALLTAVIVVLAVFAWASLFKVVPHCNVSLFRYRLWRLRDQLVDDIRHGEFEDDEQPQDLVSLVEGVIQNAGQLTALNMVLIRLSVRGMKPPELLDLARVSTSDREVLKERLGELERAMVSHTITGTPSGWGLALVVVPIAAVVVLLDRLFRGERDEPFFQTAKLQVQEEFDPDPALALLGREVSPGGRSLAQSV